MEERREELCGFTADHIKELCSKCLWEDQIEQLLETESRTGITEKEEGGGTL